MITLFTAIKSNAKLYICPNLEAGYVHIIVTMINELKLYLYDVEINKVAM